MFWIKEYRSWRSVVVEHYGGIENFHDASTVRILLEGARKELLEIDRFFKQVKGKIRDDDPAILQQKDEQREVFEAEKELLEWLKNKGLEP